MSTDAWPAGATRDHTLVQAITGDHGSDPFYTTYLLDTATGRQLTAIEHDHSVIETFGETVIFGSGGRIRAISESP